MKIRFTASILILAAAASCISGNGAGNGSAGENPAPQASAPQAQSPTVTAARETKQVPVSNGVIISDNEVPIYSRIQGQLGSVNLTEGQRVSKGSVLFRLDDQELRASVELGDSEVEEARLRMEDILISQGYKRDRLDQVPANILLYARIKSGLNSRQKELEIRKTKLSRSIVTAPVSGVVANLEARSYWFVEPGMTLCTLVDTDNLSVVFSVLETEVRNYSVGSQVRVSAIAYSEEIHKATVTTIGSVVDKSGMVRIVASIEDNGNLMSGMTAAIYQ